MLKVENLSKSVRTRGAILAQALLLFEKDGYDAVTMRDLAKACNLSLGAFYYHFKSKNEIVSEIFKNSLSGHIDRTLALWLQHLLILGFWYFDRCIPGIKMVTELLLLPLERPESEKAQ